MNTQYVNYITQHHISMYITLSHIKIQCSDCKVFFQQNIWSRQNEISRLSEISFPVDLRFMTHLGSLPLSIWWILNQNLSIPWGWASSQSRDETGLATSGDWRGCLFKSSMQGRVSRGGLLQHLRKFSDMASGLDSPHRTFWKLVSYYERKRTMNLALLLKWYESSV